MALSVDQCCGGASEVWKQSRYRRPEENIASQKRRTGGKPPTWGVSWKALEDPVGRLPLTQLGHWLLLHLGWAAGGSSNCSQAKALNVGIGPRKTYGALTSTDPHRTSALVHRQ